MTTAQLTIAQRVTTLIAEQLGLAEASFTPESNLVTDLGSDSLDQIELVMAVEDEFGLEIPDVDAEACKTVQNVIDLVLSKVSA